MEDPIREINDLIEALGLNSSDSTFVLFIGSAVSGKNSPKVPMMDKVMGKIFKNIKKCLSSGPDNEKIAANYAISLCEKGKYNYIVENTKFEEFLGIIQLVVGRSKLNELIQILYLCKDEEYGPNQSAISWLLEKGICSICLTTNFDNSIENASKLVKTYTHLTYPGNLIANAKTPILLKLHGDVKNNTCVTTNRSLFEHTNANTYKFLINLLENRKILVCGYSGDGDVDINPYLSQTKADFYWCIHKESKPIQKYSKSKVISNLESNDSTVNLLQGLASHYGWKFDHKKKDHACDVSLKEWCCSIEHKKLVNIVVHTLLGNPGWPVIHLMSLFPYTLNSKNSDINKGRACLQKSAYGPAEKIFTKLVNTKNLNQRQLITSRLYLGFVQWRKGKFKKAINTLWWFYSIDPSLYDDDDGKKIEISDGLRMYLEVVRDWMQLKSFKCSRRKIFTKYRGTDIIKKYKTMKTYDFKDDILKRVVLLHINFLKGEPINEEIINKISKLFNQSYDTKNWSIAEAVGRLLISVSFTKGLKALIKVDKKLIKRRQWNVLRKSLAAILNKITLGIFPWITIGLIDSPLLYNIVAPFIDYRYKRKLITWEKQINNKNYKIS